MSKYQYDKDAKEFIVSGVTLENLKKQVYGFVASGEYTPDDMPTGTLGQLPLDDEFAFYPASDEAVGRLAAAGVVRPHRKA